MKLVPWIAALLLAAAFSACAGRDEAGDSTAPASTSPAAAPDSTGTSPAATPTPAPGGSARVAGPAEFDGKRALEHIRQLASVIGPRVSGTQAEKDAADYIAAEFRASGYDVELMSFPIEENRFGTVLIDGQKPGLQSLLLSGSGKGSATGKAVYVGIADETAVAGKDLAGVIAVADRGGGVAFARKYENVRSAGASGLVIINNASGLFTGNLVKTADIPVAGVAGEDGPALKSAASAGRKLTIETPETAMGVNVIARSRAGDRCLIIVGGHHDSVPAVPGATDNASGAGTTIELARAYAADGLDAGLCFATFGGEESGLFGSAALAKRLRDDGSLPKFMVNLDVTATGRALDLIGDRQLQEQALVIAKKLGVAAEASSDPANTGSDHMSFRQVGVPVIFIAGDDYSTIHTTRDTFESLNPDIEEKAGDVAFALVGELLKQVARAGGGS